MKKSKIIIISTLSLCLISSLSVGIYFLCNYFNSKKNDINNGINDLLDINEKTLTNEIVKNNFSNMGVWENKTALEYNEFLDYEYIDVDAFNNINNVIEYIEIPSNILIVDKENKNLVWSQIKEIRIRDVEKRILFIEDNILYCKDGQNNVAYTISNRVIETSITINNYNNFPTSIYKKFYNKNIFKNITKINFSNNCSIKFIGDEAFLDCTILNSNIILNASTSLTNIGYQSFKNTNIETFTIIGDYKFNIYFSNEVFSNSKNLTSFSCINFNSSTWNNNAFENVNENFSFLDDSNIAFFNENSKLIGNNLFNHFSLNLFYKKINSNSNNILLSGFNVSNIDNFEMRGFLTKTEWENRGLDQELLDKYQRF